MLQIGFKTLSKDSKSPVDTFSYLMDAPSINIIGYQSLRSKVVDDHFWPKKRFFSIMERAFFHMSHNFLLGMNVFSLILCLYKLVILSKTSQMNGSRRRE